ncbi:MAG: WSD1 family O-acyltransferase, partial [Cryobacterium sp.]|nr:WSD1 family O-acyltransferase [Cryobacterium sp.]
LVVRGGYGVFYDRPSAAFINTVFSNYPFLREIEITVPSGNVTISFAVLSYAGSLRVTITVDPDACPDLPLLRRALKAELDALARV